MSVRRVGPFDLFVSIRERVADRSETVVRLHSNNDEYVMEMTPSAARKLARKLTKYARLAEQ